MTEARELTARLNAIRRTARRRLTAFGLCAVLAGGVLSFLTIVTIDWLLHLPWLLRVFVAIAFIAGFVAATTRWILTPLRASLTLEEIAGRLERRFPELGDALSSAVNFTSRRDWSSGPMTQRVIDQAQEVAQALPLEGALTLRPMAVRAGWLVVALAALFGVMAIAPDWTRTGLERYVDPLGTTEWPRTVLIKPLTSDLVAAVGDSQTIRMTVSRGMSESLRAVVYLREAGDRPTALAMRREPDGTFAATIDALTRDLDYWFEAGDDSTAKYPFHIRIVERPAVLEVRARIEPPAYADAIPERSADLSGGPVTAISGSTAHIEVRSSKPFTSNSDGRVSQLRLGDGQTVPLEAADDQQTRAVATLPLSQDVSFQCVLWDDDGFSNRGGSDYVLRVVPDAPPQVVVHHPPALTEVTPAGVVPVAAQITDDLGIAEISLVTESSSQSLAPPQRLTINDSAIEVGGVSMSASLEWSMAPLQLAPGDALTGYVQALDNRHVNGAYDGQVGVSSRLHIKIISVAEFETRLRSDIAVIESRLRQLMIEQAGLLNVTEQVRNDLGDDGTLSAAAKLAVSQSSAEQFRMVRPLQDLARRMTDMVDRMARNRVGDADDRDQLQAIGTALEHVSDGPVSASGDAMRRAADGPDAEEQRKALVEAALNQQQAVSELQSVLRSVAQWGGFQGMLTRANDLLERQESIRANTKALGKALLGLSIDALTPEQSADLKELAAEQQQLGRDVDEWLNRLTRERDNTESSDAATAAAIEDAIRTADAHELTARTRAAADAIDQNRTAGALMEQKAAAKAMRKAIAALRQRDKLALAELRKKLSTLREQVAVLIEDETSVFEATGEAGLLDAPGDVFGRLERQQRGIRVNTGALADDASLDQATASLGPMLREAAALMREAELKLRSSSADSAKQVQAGAIALLQETLDALDEQARQAENDAFRRTLADVRESLEAIRDAQREVNEGMEELKTAVDRAGRIERIHAREAVRLSRSQRDVLVLVDEVLPEVERVVVYRWALERVTGWMQQIQTELYGRRINDEAVATSRRIVHELDKLIGALEETEALPMDTDFVEAESSGNTGGDSAATAVAVPTVAELLVLKTLQLDINNRTQGLSESIDMDQPSEADLRQLKAVGEDQTEVKRLSELVTQRARE